MNILYIHQYFITPDKPGATRSYWISQELLKNGHKVTMLTSNAHQEEKVKYYDANGISVISLKVGYSNSMGVFSRLGSFVRFMLSSTRIAWKQKKIDLVIATSTPLTVGFPALVLKWFKRKPFLFEVRDLWPEVPIQMGALKNKLIIAVAKAFEKTIYRNAKHIVALSPGMEDGVLDCGIPAEKVSMISNMAKIDQFWVRPRNEELARELQLDNATFKIIYFGSLGLSNAVDYILDTAALMKENNTIEFLFLGYGLMVDTIKKRKEKEELQNVRFLGEFNMEQTSEIVNLCDVSLVTFTNLPILATNSPNKLFDSLSAGKPIIVNSAGWTKKMVEEHQCGIFVDPTSPEDFKNKVLELKENPEIRALMAKNARTLAETKYDKSILCKEFVEVVHQLKSR